MHPFVMNTMLKKLTLLLGAVCLFAINTHAQSQGEVWDLERCITHALDNNIQVRQSQLSLENAKINRHQANSNLLPNLNGFTGFNRNNGRNINQFTNEIVDQSTNQQSMNLSSNITVFDGFRLTNSRKQAGIDVFVAENNLESTKNNVTLNVVSFYTNVLFNKELLRAAELRLETTDLQVELIEKQVNAGTQPRSALFDIQAQQAQDEVEVIRATNNLDLALLNLKQALLLEGSTAIQIEYPEVQLPESEADIPPYNVNNLYSTALGEQPVIKSVDLQIQSAEYGIKVAKSGYYPTLTLGASISSFYSDLAPEFLPDPNSPSGFVQNTYLRQLDFNRNLQAQASLNIPIFNRFVVKNDVRRAKVNLENAQVNALQTKQQLRQDIEQAYQNMRAAALSYLANQRQVNALQESFKNAEAQFRLGATDAFNYKQIKNNLIQAESDLLRSKFDYVFSTKVLDFYKGVPITF